MMDLQSIQELIDSKAWEGFEQAEPRPYGMSEEGRSKKFPGFWDTTNEEYGKFYGRGKEGEQQAPPPDLDDTLKDLGLEGYTGSGGQAGLPGADSSSDPFGLANTGDMTSLDAQRQQLKSSYAERYMKNECSVFWRNLKALKDGDSAPQGGAAEYGAYTGTETGLGDSDDVVDVLAMMDKQYPLTPREDNIDDVVIHTVPSSASSMRTVPNY